MSFELQRYRNLPSNLQTVLRKSSCKDDFIYILKQTRPQLAMDGDTLINDDASEVIDIQQCLSPLRLCFLCASARNHIQKPAAR